MPNLPQTLGFADHNAPRQRREGRTLHFRPFLPQCRQFWARLGIIDPRKTPKWFPAMSGLWSFGRRPSVSRNAPLLPLEEPSDG